MNDRRILRWLPYVCLFMGGILGCADGKPKLYGVSGEIKWQGKPLDQGVITFLPADSTLPSGGGAMIQEGQYSIPAKQGLLPGRYKVMVASSDPKNRTPDPDSPPGYLPVAKDRILPKYNVQTILGAEVTTDGPNKFNFEVQ